MDFFNSYHPVNVKAPCCVCVCARVGGAAWESKWLGVSGEGNAHINGFIMAPGPCGASPEEIHLHVDLLNGSGER